MTAQGEGILAYLDRAITAREEAAEAVGFNTIQATDYIRGSKLLVLRRGPISRTGYDMEGSLADHVALHDPETVLRRCAADRRLVDLYTITKRLAGRADDADAVDLIDAARKNLRALESVVQILAEGYGWTGASDE